MDLGLAGRVALVCGSTKGLGRAVAKGLAQEGARVAINGRHDDSVERVAQQLSSETGHSVAPFVADVGVPAQAEDLVERVNRELGRLDVLFCNASGPPSGPFSHQPAEAFHRAVVLGFAKALADEVAADGITVNVVCPGFIATERIGELTETRAKREQRTSQDVMREMVEGIPIGRMGRTDELAAAVEFLASERASYITGAVLQVGGGFTRLIFWLFPVPLPLPAFACKLSGRGASGRPWWWGTSSRARSWPWETVWPSSSPGGS